MRFAIPITKFEKLADGRLKIAGLASDETLDSQGDILEYEGTKRAASFWRGNIREAHDPKKPVGKALSINFDDVTRTMEIEAFISSGAPETQAKITEGVIGSFSVGGGNPTKVEMVKRGDRMVRLVKEWEMSELSVVDAPANPNANFELVKADGTATAVLADELPQAVAEASNRFAKALLDEVQKMKPGKPTRGDALTVETKKPAQNARAAFQTGQFDTLAQQGGTGTGTNTMPGAASPKSNAEVKTGPQSKPRIDAADDVDDDDTALKTGPNESPALSTTEENVLSSPAPTTAGAQSMAPAQSAATDPAAQAAPGTSASQSLAPLDSAEASENKKPAPGTAGADSSAAVNPPAAGVEPAGVGSGSEPAFSDNAIEDTAEAGGSDTEEDMIDGKKKRSPKGSSVSVPRGSLSGKAASASLKKDMDAEAGEVVDPDELEPPDTSNVAQKCAKCGSVMACQKCQKDDGGMALSMKSVLSRLDAIETYTKTTDTSELFKTHNGDQLAEGIGKGLSIVNDEIAKANAELKDSIGVEFKSIRESIEKLAKTAAVPTPLRSAAHVAERAPVVGTEQLAKVRTLETLLASITNPEASAEIQRALNVARMNAGLPVGR